MGKLVVFDLWIGPQHGVVALKHTQAKGGMDSAIGAGSWRMTLQCEGGIRFVRVNHPMMPRRHTLCLGQGERVCHHVPGHIEPGMCLGRAGDDTLHGVMAFST